MSKENLSVKTRTLIVKTGLMLQGAENQRRGLPLDADTKIKFTDIQRKIESNHYENQDNELDVKAIKHWWKRRDIFFKTDQLAHKPRSWRPKHKAFDTEEKIGRVVEYVLSLPMGCHQSDVMEKFGIRSKKTLRKYTYKLINWYFHQENTRDMKRLN